MSKTVSNVPDRRINIPAPVPNGNDYTVSAEIWEALKPKSTP